MSPRNGAIFNLIYGRQGTDSDEPWFSSVENEQHEAPRDATNTVHTPIPESPQPTASARFAHSLRHASNSVMVVMGVVEPTSRPRPDDLRLDPPSLETRELDDQRREANHKDSKSSYSDALNYLISFLEDLGTEWRAGLSVRLLAFPIRSRLSIHQQINLDISVLGPLNFFFVTSPCIIMFHALFMSPLRAKLNYGFERLILAQVSSSNMRTILLSYQPYFDKAFVYFRFFALYPLLAHQTGQWLGLLPMNSFLPNFLGKTYWTSSSFGAQISRRILSMVLMEHLSIAVISFLRARMISFDDNYVGLGRQICKFLRLGDENSTKRGRSQVHYNGNSQDEISKSSSNVQFARRIGRRIGLGLLDHMLFDLPLEVFFLSRVVGRTPIAPGIPGFLGLRGWSEVICWLIQAELFEAVHLVTKEIDHFLKPEERDKSALERYDVF